MSLRAALARASTMDAHEVRTRVACALRTNAERARFAVNRPRWRRDRLLSTLDPSSAPLVGDACAALSRGDHLAAHRALSEHFGTRASRWPLKAAHRERLSAAVRNAFPGAATAARDAADRIVDGRFDLLGYRDVAAGNPPAWHRDPIHRRTAPRVYYADVRYLDPAVGDHKVIWEINRHQYFLALGTAFWLTDDLRYRAAFVRHLESWLDDNPPLTGTNWASMLELAFRAMSWTWAVELFAGTAADDTSPWLVDLLLAIDRQLTHVAQNLSTYFSPNTHLSGEALALYAVSLAFPELRRSGARRAVGREILLRESERQVLGDGGHAELSTHYHRYSTDFYLLACMVARAANDSAAAAFERTAKRQASYLRTIADADGRLPVIGDDDGGRLFRFDNRPSSDASSTLSVAASVLSDPSLAVRPADAEVYWILGGAPEDPDLGVRTLAWPSRLLEDSGYFVSRSGDGNHLVFDAGPHGYLNGGHAHSDALSVVLTVRGLPLLVDPGTATYTMDRAVRDRYRAAYMHNTVVIDGREPAIPAGPFRWQSRAGARVLVARTGRDMYFAAGALCGRGAVHIRAVVTLHRIGWLIVDRVASRAHTSADLWWHLDPQWQARACAGGVVVESASGGRLGLAFSRGDVTITQDPDLAAVSPEYGRVETATTIRVRHAETGPFTIGSFLSERPVTSRGIRVRDISSRPAAAPGWTAVTFAIDPGMMPEVVVELQFPEGREAQPDERWPQPCIRVGRAREMAVCAE